MNAPRRVLVTGGSGDIGGAIALSLAADGWHVHVHAHASPERAQAIVEAIREHGGSADAVVFDLVDAEATRRKIDELLAGGPIHALVHNAGIHDDAPMAGMREDQWRRVIDVSLHGFFHVCQPLLLPMARARWGRVVAVSSVAGRGSRQSRAVELRRREIRAARRGQIPGARACIARYHRERRCARRDRRTPFGIDIR